VAGRVTTSWLETAHPTWEPPGETVERAVAVAAAAEAEGLLGRRTSDPWAAAGPWRVAGAAPVRIVLRPDGTERTARVAGTGPYEVEGRTVDRTDAGWTVDGRPAFALRETDRWLVWTGTQVEVPVGIAPRRVEEHGAAHLGAPMPGQVIAVRVAAGDAVVKGQELVVVEAMKMEHAVTAPADGVVTQILCAPGDQVDRGQALIDLETS